MKQRFRLYRRPRGIYYIHDDETGKQQSLQTRDRAEAWQLFSAKTQAYRQAHLNLRLARTYLTASDPLAATRPWQTAMEELVKNKQGKWGERWGRAIKEKPFDLIRDLPIIETHAEHFLKVLPVSTVSTNVYLRRIHNFVLDMGWLPCPILPKRQWPAARYKEKPWGSSRSSCRCKSHPTFNSWPMSWKAALVSSAIANPWPPLSESTSPT